MIRASILMAGLFVVGTFGCAAIGGDRYSVLDAAYMTVITLTTVGYGEVIDLSGSPEGRVFTMALLIVGVGSFLYFFSNFTAFMVEGTLDRTFWRRRMLRKTGRLSDHVIVCGGGNTGEYVVEEFIRTGRDFVQSSTDVHAGCLCLCRLRVQAAQLALAAAIPSQADRAPGSCPAAAKAALAGYCDAGHRRDAPGLVVVERARALALSLAHAC